MKIFEKLLYGNLKVKKRLLKWQIRYLKEANALSHCEVLTCKT